MQHQIVAGQVQAQGTLYGCGQGSGAQASALGGREQRAIGTDQTAALEEVQLGPGFNSRDQAIIERPQGGYMQLGAGLGQGAVRDQDGRANGVQAGKEGVEFALHAGAAKAQQGAHKGRQRQFAGAGESLGVIWAAGGFGEGRAVQVIGKVGQNGLCKITVLRQKSCQPRGEN